MTESAAQVLAEALRDGWQMAVVAGDVEGVMRAHPELAAAIELGTAWAAAERALPVEGEPEMHVLNWNSLWRARAEWQVGDKIRSVMGTGVTAVEALRTLTEKLESNR